jgi:hypothetical protein
MGRCPKCGELRVFEDDDGWRCLCGWRMTRAICHECLCFGPCQGHLVGGDKDRNMIDCDLCGIHRGEEEETLIG